MKLYTVRHGQTIFNQLDKVQGWADTPLTAQGEHDGKAAGERLQNVRFDAALSSDTSRAMHTAEFILAENQFDTPELKVTADWREYFFGSFEGGGNHEMWGAVGDALGLPTDNPSEIGQHVDMTTIMDTIYQLDPQHLGENAATFWRRIDQSLATLQQHYPANANLLLVTHGQLIGNLAQHYGKLQTASRPKNGAVAVFDLDEHGQLHVANFNDVTTVF
ncbi:histidine phosphatase family protein [Leuconostoc citreum]|uniref:histidine phosphatase family protein n=1 Tax=Leuconostoc citreum TaxID=33964 RepID=UPI000EE3C739|nr:histidine phosphatase family protein [Leuconostoc citreum]MCJ2167731.1 phosphoglycerate mutase family protein [Leuconostoc citreum]MCT3055234.1 histidine phosphatase family protein [Leuconostoc citreum]MCT3055899.1 histidine phosphatase family protein [Leuconostoc citreum]MCT3060129.1 histidine phosphatase family protein [Leuconostoc citreum]MCT3063247.1 histidine phosphatase family protein [Leuconostoc citreum]